MQTDADGKEHFITYANGHFSDTQIHYHSVFEYHLIDYHFLVRMDNSTFPNIIMLSIFSDYVENIIKVFMDDFTIYGDSFDRCLDNLTLVLNDALILTLCLIEKNVILWLIKVLY